LSTHDEPDNGNGRATVALVDAKVDGLKDLIRAEFKDVGRRLDELAGLEPRVRQLEQDAVRRVGPIIDEMRTFEKRVDDLTTQVDELATKSVSAEQVRVALKFEREQQSEKVVASFSRKEKIAGLAFAAVLVLLNVIQILHSLNVI
jgi:hypothetical protein